jgi:hypothetical protein
MKVAVDPSVQKPPTILTYVIISTNSGIKYVSSHVINYQHVSMVYAISFRVALQEYKE